MKIDKLIFIFIFAIYYVLANDFTPREAAIRARLKTPFAKKNYGVYVSISDVRNNKEDWCAREIVDRDYCLIQDSTGASCMAQRARVIECNRGYATSISNNISNIKDANGINEVRVTVKTSALLNSLVATAKVVTEIPMIMYKVKVKQGIFLDTGSNTISFTLNDYLEKKGTFRYQIYDCNDETIVDKNFETFTLSEISTLGKDGLETKIQLQTIKVPFGCKGPYYTIRTVVEKTETKEPPMRTGGRTLDLDTVTLKDTKQVVYIDPIKGEIINVPFIQETLVKKTTEKYKLNTSSCQYEVVKKVEELPYHKSSFAYLNNLSSSLAFTKNTVLDLQISGIREKKIKVPWHELKESGRFSDTSHWVKKKTKIEKESEVKKMFKLNAKGQNKLPLLKDVSNFGIAVEQALGQDAKDTGCRIQREFYDVLENGANIIHPTVSYRYKVNIYQSSKNDIEKAKNIIERMENYSGSYTEEKQLYDGLNNPLYAPKSFEKEKSSQSEKEPSGILDTLLDRDDEENEMSIDDLQMFTK